MKRGTPPKPRKDNFKVDLIITADWHLMEKERNTPCRTDSHWDAQWGKVEQILSLQRKYGCPIELAGDLFEHWKTSPQLLNKCFETFGFKEIYNIIGNHDMPQHSLDNMKKSGWTCLLLSNCFNHSKNQLDWGEDSGKVIPKIFKRNGINKKIVIAHMMVWQGTSPWPGCSDPEAQEVFDIFPEADLIITGHNHKTFIAKKGKRLLINPGSLTRHKADQINHKPCVFLWNAETNTYKIHYLKIKKDVISREHIEIVKMKENNIQDFLKKLKQPWDIGLSFTDNLTQALEENKITNKVKQIILEWIGR